MSRALSQPACVENRIEASESAHNVFRAKPLAGRGKEEEGEEAEARSALAEGLPTCFDSTCSRIYVLAWTACLPRVWQQSAKRPWSSS